MRKKSWERSDVPSLIHVRVRPPQHVARVVFPMEREEDSTTSAADARASKMESEAITCPGSISLKNDYPSHDRMHGCKEVELLILSYF